MSVGITVQLSYAHMYKCNIYTYNIYIFAAIINEKEVMNLKQQGGLYDKIWMEERERENYVIL